MAAAAPSTSISIDMSSDSSLSNYNPETPLTTSPSIKKNISKLRADACDLMNYMNVHVKASKQQAMHTLIKDFRNNQGNIQFDN